MVQSIEDYLWRAIYENARKGLQKSAENCWSSFQGLDLERQSPLSAFLRGKIIFNFFSRGTWKISNTKYHVSVYFLRKVISLIFRLGKKNIVFSGKKYQLSRQYKKDDVPARSSLEIISEHSKKISYFPVFFGKIIFHFPSRGKIIFLGEKS